MQTSIAIKVVIGDNQILRGNTPGRAKDIWTVKISPSYCSSLLTASKLPTHMEWPQMPRLAQRSFNRVTLERLLHVELYVAWTHCRMSNTPVIF